MIKISPAESPEEFENAMLVLTDYLKTYGEIFFQILSKQRREAIDVRIILAGKNNSLIYHLFRTTLK
jgi:hypothetical protein